jgi:hypothetical protein
MTITDGHRRRRANQVRASQERAAREAAEAEVARRREELARLKVDEIQYVILAPSFMLEPDFG